MKGLNIEHYKKYYDNQHSYELTERIKLINSFMEYEVIPDTREAQDSDALKIAQLLGLSSKVISNAEIYLGEDNASK